MKTIYIITFILISFFSKSQQSEITNNTWNLEKVVLNNIEYYFPTSTNTIHATANFTSNNFNSHICNTLSADIVLNNDQIIFNGSGLTLGSCPDFNNNEYNVFETHYFGQFFGSNTTNGIYALYNYQVENINDNLKLTLINPNGDKAIYWSQNLSVNNQNSDVFKIYPNPVGNILTIETEKNSRNLNITITDIQGKSIIDRILNDSKQNKIDLSKLTSGVYFLRIKIEDKDYLTKILKK